MNFISASIPCRPTLAYSNATAQPLLKARPSRPNAAMLVPVVGIFTVFHHGQDATIKPGAPFTAYMDPSSLVSSSEN